MWNTAYLIAKQEELDRSISGSLNPLFDPKEGTLTYTSQGVSKTINIRDGVTGLEYRQINAYHHYQKQINLILGKEPQRKSYEQCAAEYFLEGQLKRHLGGCTLKSGVLTYTVEGAVRQVSLDPDKPSHDISKLECVELFKSGALLKEVPGEHFLIYLGDGPPLATTPLKCSCEEFEGFKTCVHSRVVSFLCSNRKLYLG